MSEAAKALAAGAKDILSIALDAGAARATAHRAARSTLGLGRRYGQGSGATIASIPSQWDRFLPHYKQIQGQVGDASYGVCCNTGDNGSFEYITGVEVADFPDEPRELSRLRVPPQTYAVFAHPGHVSTVHGTWEAIWDHALRDAGLQAADGPGFERYGAQFDSETGSGGLEIWIPIKP